MDFWRTKKFRLVSQEWSQKLKQSGFQDIESESPDDRALKQRASNSYRQADPLERESKLEYYLCLGHFAQNTEFENPCEKFIMLRHADGASIQDILKELAARSIYKDRWAVRFIIRRWQMKWGIKNWSLKQLNLKAPTQSSPIIVRRCRKSS